MQTLVTIPLKDKNEICMFLSTDVVRGTAVMNADHKEGYLTKRGKNFGGSVQTSIPRGPTTDSMVLILPAGRPATSSCKALF